MRRFRGLFPRTALELFSLVAPSTMSPNCQHPLKEIMHAAPHDDNGEINGPPSLLFPFQVERALPLRRTLLTIPEKAPLMTKNQAKQPMLKAMYSTVTYLCQSELRLLIENEFPFQMREVLGHRLRVWAWMAMAVSSMRYQH